MRFLSWLVGLALLALLAFFCVTRKAPRIEAALTADAQTALQEAGLDTTLVTLDGRDACLKTIPDTEVAAEARQIVESVNGIRVVNTGCGEIALARPYFRAERAADEIIIEGSMIPGEASRVYNVVNSLGPSVPVVRRIITDGVADEAWTGALPDAIRLVAARVLDPALTVVDGVVTVSGRVPSEGVREGVIQRLEQLFPGFEIVDRLEVRPPETGIELQRGLDQFVASRVVEFKTDSATLTPSGRETVDEVAALLKSIPGLKVEISGHTDATGDDAFNLDLSRRRAISVRDRLVEQGLSGARFATAGFGETRPIADNETPEGRQRNRRTEFRVIEEN